MERSLPSKDWHYTNMTFGFAVFTQSCSSIHSVAQNEVVASLNTGVRILEEQLGSWRENPRKEGVMEVVNPKSAYKLCSNSCPAAEICPSGRDHLGYRENVAIRNRKN